MLHYLYINRIEEGHGKKHSAIWLRLILCADAAAVMTDVTWILSTSASTKQVVIIMCYNIHTALNMYDANCVIRLS